ncbi:MAG: hypothetical protein HXY51_13220 [Nitrospirae bacterium]|nr:hypothetical protein [Nitrospirota bacterium]
MSKTPSRAKSVLIPGCLVMVCLALTACTGGTNTSKASRADGQGSKAALYETDYDGQTSTRNTQDSKAKHQVPASHKAEQRRAKKGEQIEGLSIAPKRRPNDPIYVSLVPPVLDSKMQQAEKSKGAVERQIRSEFTSDPIIKLIEGDRSSSDKGKLRAAPSIADVEVAPKVSIKDIYVLQPQTGKPGKMTAVIFEATITSQEPPVTSTVSETGHVLQNVEVSKRFATQIKQVILERIGPGIPAH